MIADALMHRLARKRGMTLVRANQARFQSVEYLRHNSRRLEHLASLRIPVANSTVLEVGAGVGDHSHYYIDRECRVTITEARPENLETLRARYPDHRVEFLDMDNPQAVKGSPFDVVHCYGLLYHLHAPGRALEFLSDCCKDLLLLETCVSFGDEQEINLLAEDQGDATQAVSGTGCRPTRRWIFNELQRYFEHVYLPKTQPNHEQFPMNWTRPENHHGLSRAIFIASRESINNELLTTELVEQQTRHA